MLLGLEEIIKNFQTSYHLKNFLLLSFLTIQLVLETFGKIEFVLGKTKLTENPGALMIRPRIKIK